MTDQQKSAIEEYQCSGCMSGYNIECFGKSTAGVGCGEHYAGTMIMGIGKIFLGMPKGFNRLGNNEKMYPYIFDTFESSDWPYDMFNIPVWKYKNSVGHTIVRGISPRINVPFIHIFLEDCIDKVNCFQITEDNLNEMD